MGYHFVCRTKFDNTLGIMCWVKPDKVFGTLQMISKIILIPYTKSFEINLELTQSNQGS